MAIDGTTKITALSPVGNGASPDIIPPYSVRVMIEGTAAILFHRWDNEAVAAKGAAAKNSAAKKRDNLDSYVYRCDDGTLGIPGAYLVGSVVTAAKFRQDPRSPRKSAMDLFRAGVIPLTELATLGISEPDYIDRRRVMVQRSAITRERPALRAGWRATFELLIQTPEYIDAQTLLTVIGEAGRLVGVGDFRPTYGRFQPIGFEVNQEP